MADRDIGALRTRLSWEDEGANQGLEGFKRDLRGLRSEMALAKSGGRDYTNSLKGMKEQSDILTRKFQTQQAKVKELTQRYNQLKDAGEGDSEAAQKLAKDINHATAEMNRTEGQLKRLNAEIKTQESRWTIAGQKMVATGDKMQKIGGGMSKVGKVWTKGITLPIVGMGTAAVAAAKKTADHADKVIIASQKAGMSTKSYQELNYALKQMGLEQSDVDRALGRLNQRMGRAADGNKKYGEALEAVGISQEDLKNGTYSTDEAFIKIIASLQKVESSQERSAMASEIFGTNMSRKLMPAINGGTKELEELRNKAHDAGAVMSGKALKDSQKFKAAMDELKERGAGLTHELGARLAPVLTNKLIPVIEEKGIPMLEKMADGAVDLVEWFSNLDDGTKKLITRLGLFAVAGGPVLSVTGKMTSGIGGVVKGAGKLSKTLGKAGGSGTVGILAKGLTKGGIAGLAIAGVVGLAAGIYKLNQRSKKTKEVNLDLANSLSDQSIALENAADTFDKLSEKAKISNAELAELNDLNKRISESSNPGEIKELKDRYNELAEKSGLSKDEIKALLKANDTLIDKSPNVNKSISEQGNAFAKNTDAVREYVDSLREASLVELESERQKNLEEVKRLQKEITQEKKNQAKTDEQIEMYNAANEMSQAEIKARLQEIGKLKEQAVGDQAEQARLIFEEQVLTDVLNGDYGEQVTKLQAKKDESRKNVDNAEKEIEKANALTEQMGNIILKQVGVNEEGKKGLAQLDKTIDKNNEEINKLESKKQKTGELSSADQDRLGKLRKTVKEQENARQKIYEQTGLYNDLNKLVDGQLSRLDKEQKKKVKNLLKTTDIKVEEGNILKQLQNKNSEHDKEIKQLEESKKKEGANKKEIQNQIDELKRKKQQNNDVKKQILKEIGLNDKQIDQIMDLTSKHKNQGKEIFKNNDKTRRGIELEVERTNEAGKKVTKKVKVDPSYMPTALSKDLSEQVKKTVKLGLNPIGSAFSIPMLRYAKGTDSTKGHPFDGPAMLNDGKGSNSGPELVQTPDGKAGMFKGRNIIANLPKGTHVWSAKETKSILNNIPRYAKGTNNPQLDFTIKGVKKGALSALKAASIASSALTGIVPSMLPILAKNLTTDPSKVASMGGDGTKSKPAKKWRSEILRAAAQMKENVTNAQVQGIILQIARESGGNPKITQSPAVVDINTLMGNPAQGLLQYIPQTFNAYKVPGYGNIKNGYHQLLAFFNNKNWRRDLPYGMRGWGPTGGRKYEKGTKNHPGGQFIAGENGWELGRLGNKWEVLNAGVYDRPRGYEVYPHQESKKIMRAIHDMPGYADGTQRARFKNGKSYDKDLLDATLEQNEILMQILDKDPDIYIDKKLLTKEITTEQKRTSNRQRRLAY